MASMHCRCKAHLENLNIMEIILPFILLYSYVLCTLHNYTMTSLTIATTNQFEVTCGALRIMVVYSSNHDPM